MNSPFLTKNRPKVSFLQDERAGSKFTKAVPKNAGRFFSKGATRDAQGSFRVEQKKKISGWGGVRVKLGAFSGWGGAVLKILGSGVDGVPI